MAKFVIGWVNHVVRGSVTAGASVPNLRAPNLQDDSGAPSSAWQTPAGVLTPAAGAYVVVDSGNVNSKWRLFGVHRSNLSEGASVRWRVAADNLFGSPFYDSGANGGVRAGYNQHVTVAPAEVTGRYCRCDLSDSGNPQNFLSVAHMFAGPCWQPPLNFTSGTGWGREVNALEVKTRGGQEHPEFLSAQRYAEVDLQMLPKSEAIEQAMELEREAARGGNVLFAHDPDDADRHRLAVFGRLRSLASFTYSARGVSRRNWRFRVTERL